MWRHQLIPIGQLTRFTNLGIDVCLFIIRSIEVLSRRSCTDAYLLYSVQLSHLRSLVMKTQTIFVISLLLSTLVMFVIQLWIMTTYEVTNLAMNFLVIIPVSIPVVDLIYSSVDYSDKVNLSVFLIQFSNLKK